MKPQVYLAKICLPNEDIFYSLFYKVNIDLYEDIICISADNNIRAKQQFIKLIGSELFFILSFTENNTYFKCDLDVEQIKKSQEYFELGKLTKGFQFNDQYESKNNSITNEILLIGYHYVEALKFVEAEK